MPEHAPLPPDPDRGIPSPPDTDGADIYDTGVPDGFEQGMPGPPGDEVGPPGLGPWDAGGWDHKVYLPETGLPDPVFGDNWIYLPDAGNPGDDWQDPPALLGAGTFQEPPPIPWVPPDGPEPGYVPPNPPPADADNDGLAGPFAAPDPLRFGAGTPPEPSAMSAGNVRATEYIEAAVTAGQAHLLFNAGIIDSFDEHGQGVTTFQAADLQLEKPHVVAIVQGGKQYDVNVFVENVSHGVATIGVGIGGQAATIVIPVPAAGAVTIHIEPSKDPGKVADVIVSAPVAVPIDVHSSGDIAIKPEVPFGPPAEPPHHAHHLPPHHRSHPAEQPTPKTDKPAGPTDATPKPTPAHQDSPQPAPASPVEPSPPVEPTQPAHPPPTPDQPPFDPTVVPPLPHEPDPNAPTLQDLLRPDPPKTGFENNLAGRKPFTVSIPAHSDIDVSAITWLTRPPVDLKHTSFEVVGNPAARVTAETQGHDLAVDPAAVMPIRDPRTKDLLGYRMRRGETMYTFDREGRLSGADNLEAPLQQPAVDPLDVVMVGIDLGPIIVKGIMAKGIAAKAGVLLPALTKMGWKEGGKFVRGPAVFRVGSEEIDLLSSMWRKRLVEATNDKVRREAEQALKALADQSRIRNWRQSEREVAHLYEQIGGKAESREAYFDENGIKRITKPDFSTSAVRGEVKNWEMVHIKSDVHADQLIDHLAAQVKARRSITPQLQQTVVFDLRGQALTDQNLHTIGHVIAERTGLPVENIQLIVWGK